jgi:endonuclease-3
MALKTGGLSGCGWPKLERLYAASYVLAHMGDCNSNTTAATGCGPLCKLAERSQAYLKEGHPLDALNQTRDPWVLGVAAILSAHCTDAAVNKVMGPLAAKFPVPSSMIGRTRADVIPLLPGISHSGNKSDYLINWAKHLVERNNRPAATIGELTEIKGIGRKTAAIILYTALGVDEGIPLDTHALRIIDRVQCCPALKNPKAIEKKLLAEFPQGERYNLHLVLTLHGRKICQARSPRCADCCITDCCPSSLFRQKDNLTVK